MRKYLAFYRGRQVEVEAATSLEAQRLAAGILKVRKTWEVQVMLADVVHVATE